MLSSSRQLSIRSPWIYWGRKFSCPEKNQYVVFECFETAKVTERGREKLGGKGRKRNKVTADYWI